MANYKVTDSELSGIASAIRLKGGTSDPLVFPSGFVSAISAIETQGTYISKTITLNGEYDPSSDNADAFSHVTVSVPSPVLVSKTISSNGTYNPTDDNADAYSQVVVNVSGGGGNDIKYIENTYSEINDNTASFVGKYAFAFHSNLKKVSILNASFIENGAFSNCVELEEVFLPSVESVCNAFANCRKLSSISFPECLTVSQFAFDGCYSLSHISLPKCTYIGTAAFRGNSNLTEIYIPEIKGIESSTFQSCSNIGSITLPKISEIKTTAFYNCRKLSVVNILASSVVSLMSFSAFANTPLLNSIYLGYYGSVYVPASLVESYKSASVWSLFSDRITSYVEE